jgi:WD40 repeat protein
MQAGSDSDGKVWSLAWSRDANDVIAGTSLPGIIVYDMQAEAVKSRRICHEDDVNAVCFVDSECNMLASGSDDSLVLLHDRCALRLDLFLIEISRGGALCLCAHAMVVSLWSSPQHSMVHQDRPLGMRATAAETGTKNVHNSFGQPLSVSLGLMCGRV